MFSADFAHYLSYGATDQTTLRDLAGQYTGLLVPGTIAAFQREGTGGFILTLSATPEAPEYAIDPRFPLFQQALSNPKKSHQSLADLLGVPGLIRTSHPSPEDFTEDVIRSIAKNWADFNGAYQSAAGSKFDKYAKRLGQEVRPHDAHEPSYVFPPYFVVSSAGDPWRGVSERLYAATEEALHGDPRCVRVLATTNPVMLAELVTDLPETRAAIWVSALDEITSSPETLRLYGAAVQQATAAGKSLFALYGGFFSVLLGGVGLAGSSHGIGFGENRNWIELPESGPPPARYYLPQLHRYVQVDEAARLYAADPRLAACGCAECHGESPLGLDYHSLMKHSVRCRAAEIASWSGLSPDIAADRLERERTEFRQILHASGMPDIAIGRIEQRAAHLGSWITALQGL